MNEITIENIKARLGELTIFELRQTARAVGVSRSADGPKAECIKKIVAIAKGEENPVPVEDRKFCEYADKGLVKDIQSFRESILG